MRLPISLIKSECRTKTTHSSHSQFQDTNCLITHLLSSRRETNYLVQLKETTLQETKHSRAQPNNISWKANMRQLRTTMVGTQNNHTGTPTTLLVSWSWNLAMLILIDLWCHSCHFISPILHQPSCAPFYSST